MRLNKSSKIEKVVSSDPTQRVLNNPYLRIDEGGVKGTLIASNKKNAVVLPVVVELGDVAGPVPIEALKELRKVPDGSLQLTSEYAVLPNGAAFPRLLSAVPSFPPIEQILVPSAVGTVEVAVSAKALYELAQAMGADVVKIKIPVQLVTDPDLATSVSTEKVKVVGVEPHGSEPHHEGARAALLVYQVARL